MGRLGLGLGLGLGFVTPHFFFKEPRSINEPCTVKHTNFPLVTGGAHPYHIPYVLPPQRPHTHYPASRNSCRWCSPISCTVLQKYVLPPQRPPTHYSASRSSYNMKSTMHHSSTTSPPPPGRPITARLPRSLGSSPRRASPDATSTCSRPCPRPCPCLHRPRRQGHGWKRSPAPPPTPLRPGGQRAAGRPTATTARGVNRDRPSPAETCPRRFAGRPPWRRRANCS